LFLHLVDIVVKTPYTVSQKTIHLNFDHNFGKCGPICKILSLSYSSENFVQKIIKVLHHTFTIFLHYLVQRENHNCFNFNDVLYVTP